MADTLKRGDTWPPIRGRASDEDGAMDLAAADYVLFLAKAGSTLISGTAFVIDPPDADGMNWSYTPDADDFSVIGAYKTEIEIHWDEAAVPPKVETVPNTGTETITIEQDQGGS